MNFIESVRAELVTDLQGILDDAALTNVLVTTDPDDIESAARHGVVIVTPPDLSYPTFSQVEATHELVMIAGPPTDLDAAASTLANILEAFRKGMVSLDTATPDTFQPKNMLPHAGYTVRLTPMIHYPV